MESGTPTSRDGEVPRETLRVSATPSMDGDGPGETLRVDFDSSGPQAYSADDAPECPICMGFLVDPLELRCCSHAFCRLCLFKTTHLSPDGRSCPLCRSPIEVPDLKLEPVSHAHAAAVSAAVPADILAARLTANAKEMQELSRQQQKRLPIFFMPPGTSVGAVVALHFFEPRYKLLIRRAWEGNRLFVYTAGVPRPGARGVLVQVDTARFLPDGRANIRGRSVQSIALGQTWVEDGTGGLFCTELTELPTTPPAGQRPSGPPDEEDLAVHCTSCALM